MDGSLWRDMRKIQFTGGGNGKPLESGEQQTQYEKSKR